MKENRLKKKKKVLINVFIERIPIVKYIENNIYETTSLAFLKRFTTVYKIKK